MAKYRSRRISEAKYRTEYNEKAKHRKLKLKNHASECQKCCIVVAKQQAEHVGQKVPKSNAEEPISYFWIERHPFCQNPCLDDNVLKSEFIFTAPPSSPDGGKQPCP